MGESSAETADISAGAESHSTANIKFREAPVALQLPDMTASPEKLQGPQPTEGQSFPTVPAQGDQSKQSTKTPLAIPRKGPTSVHKI